MEPSEVKRRAEIVDAALRARTESAVESAVESLDAWLKDHPEDDSIRDAYEPLTLRQMNFASQRNSVSSPSVLIGSKS